MNRNARSSSDLSPARFCVCATLFGGVFLLAVATGCQLFKDHSSIRPAPPCEVGTRISCPCPGQGSGFQVCTSERRYGACRCSDDANSGDATKDADVDAADSAMDSKDGTYSASCSAGRVAYPVPEAQAAPSIDGNCDEAAYGAPIEFSAPSDESPPLNYSDNRGRCWLAWKSGQPAEIFGCCDIEDTKPFAETAPGDPLPTIWGENPDGPDDQVSPDDRVEHMVRNNLEVERGPSDAKYYLNNATDPGPATFAHSYDASGDMDLSFEGIVAAESVRDNAGWKVEWRANLPFSVSPPKRGLCEVRVHDVDDGVHGGAMWGFSATSDPESPSDWGCCVYREAD